MSLRDNFPELESEGFAETSSASEAQDTGSAVGSRFGFGRQDDNGPGLAILDKGGSLAILAAQK